MSNDTTFLSPIVNGKRMPGYVGHRARVAGRILSVEDEGKILKLSISDGAIVTARFEQPTAVANTYVELVGTVTANREMAGDVLLDLGNDFELKYFDFAVEITHDPKFGLKLKST